MQSGATSFANDLIARFRRQQPIRGGSLIVTLFGDSIAPRGGAITLGSLIRLAGPFGLNERLVRTAVTRLAQDGWVSARRDGRLSEYHLSDEGRHRFAEATSRIYKSDPGTWLGRWTLVVLPSVAAAERRQLRKELTWHGFGELPSGMFARPASEEDDLDPLTWEHPLPADALIFEASLVADRKPTALIEKGWDLKDLALKYQRFLQRYERALISLGEGRPEPRAAFAVRTLLIHEYRRLHLRDPLLPTELLPTAWPGARAAQLCQAIYRLIFEASEEHLSSVATRLGGPLPPPEPAVKKRFGGLGLGTEDA